MRLRELSIPLKRGSARLLGRPGEGPTLVLLHGASGNADTFAPVLKAWPWGDVWSPDLPGRGGSEGPPLEDAFAVAEWLAEVLEGMDLRGQVQPILVGHSFGGAVALAFALTYPERVGGVVLVSSASRLRVAPAILEAVAASTPEEPFTLEFAFGPETAEAVIARYHADARATQTATSLADWQACDAFDVRARLGEVRIPTLIAHGSEDVLTPPRHQARLAEDLPNARRVTLEGVGHMLPWEAPATLAEAVEGWWKGR